MPPASAAGPSAAQTDAPPGTAHLRGSRPASRSRCSRAGLRPPRRGRPGPPSGRRSEGTIGLETPAGVEPRRPALLCLAAAVAAAAAAAAAAGETALVGACAVVAGVVVAATGRVTVLVTVAAGLESPARVTTAAAMTPSDRATRIASTVIAALRFGEAASRVRAAAPQRMHHSWPGSRYAPHSGQASTACVGPSFAIVGDAGIPETVVVGEPAMLT